MKDIKYILLALICCMATSCMDDDWENPYPVGSPYGNRNLTETNVITIKQLKDQYTSVIFNSTNSYKEITDDIQIKGYVTGNDIGGNIYNEVAIDDGTGALLVCIAQGGLFSYMPVGTEILIDLKGLYIGGYGQQPELGTPYTNKNGASYVSRMSRILWNDHFKILNTSDKDVIAPVEFDKSKYRDADYIQENCGKLMTIKGVTFKKADGKTTFAPDKEKDAANSVNRGLVGLNDSYMVVRTSTYANFAADALPTGTVNITGIFTRYRSTWQILIRTAEDIEIINQ